jgi:hypothetical protein
MNPFVPVGPVRFTAVANIDLLIIPPELKAAERSISVILYSKNITEIKKLFYLCLVFYTDLFHFQILHEKLSAFQLTLFSLHLSKAFLLRKVTEEKSKIKEQNVKL